MYLLIILVLLILSENVVFINSYYIKHNYLIITSKSYGSKIDNIVKSNKPSSIKFLTKLLPCISTLCSLTFFNAYISYADDNIEPTVTGIVNNNQVTNKPISLSSGVQYYDLREGEGIPAANGRTVQFLWSLRRSNGYFVDSSANYDNEPFIYKVGNLKKVIKGIDIGIQGMKPGSIRRISIPPSMAFIEGVEDDKPGPLPASFGPKRQILTRSDRETWNFEIKMLKVK